MDAQKDVLAMVLDIINGIKNTGFTPDVVELDAFIGGELGVDSVEMLESWLRDREAAQHQNQRRR
ncbi:hypothetical protein [Dickeya ananatis]|uniref:hypothetical protein n=1 Tax=Dickeya ananatis TaxID=3061286 RepID=UPI00388FB9B3